MAGAVYKARTPLAARAFTPVAAAAAALCMAFVRCADYMHPLAVPGRAGDLYKGLTLCAARAFTPLALSGSSFTPRRPRCLGLAHPLAIVCAHHPRCQLSRSRVVCAELWLFASRIHPTGVVATFLIRGFIPPDYTPPVLCRRISAHSPHWRCRSSPFAAAPLQAWVH